MLSSTTLLLLSQIPGITNAALNSLINYLEQSGQKFSQGNSDIIELFEAVKKFNARLRFKIPSPDEVAFGKQQSEIIIGNSDREGISIIGLFDSHYPPLLKEIANSPLLLHCKGDLSALKTTTVAVIGTREPSEHAFQFGPRLSKHIVDAGLTVVSGLAIGCDTIGHKAAVESKRATIAVLAGGLHTIYPKENRPLATEIIETGGLLVSELPYGQDPQRNTFVDRDRIQSGLSYGVVVLETGVKGGTLHTVKFANEQNRIVGCMYSQATEGFNDHNKFQGNKELVKNGKAMRLDNRVQLFEFIKQIEERKRHKDTTVIKHQTEFSNKDENTHDGFGNKPNQLSIF